MELQLAQIWERLLGVPTVSVHDDFFALGGHSLMAVRLINEIRESLNRSLPLPVFFQNPTIEATAKVLQTAKHPRAESELIPLQPSESPGTLFVIGAGIGLCRLAQLLRGPASFATVVPLTAAAFQAATRGKMSELPSVEELAVAHTALIRSRQPFGPCVLAGHSFGGLLAFEVAHQLQRDGRQVEMILLLDSWAITPPWWKKLKILTLARARSSVAFRARHLWSRTRAGARTQAGRLTRALQSRPAPAPDCEGAHVPFGDVPWNILHKVYRNAWRNYRCHRLDTRAVLFRSQDSELAHLYPIDGNLGWGDLFTRGLEIVETPGDHLSILQAPYVATLAQRVQECLEQLRNSP
jgi:thioesterase domain-containing protein